MEVTEYECSNCGSQVKIGDTKCNNCKAEFPALTFICCVCHENAETRFIAGKEYCFECYKKVISEVHSTTSEAPIDDHYIAVFGPISESITVSIGTPDFDQDFTFGYDDLFGTHQKMFVNNISGAQELLLQQLKFRAANLNLNSIFGVKFSITPLNFVRAIVSVSGTLAYKHNA